MYAANDGWDAASLGSTEGTAEGIPTSEGAYFGPVLLLPLLLGQTPWEGAARWGECPGGDPGGGRSRLLRSVLFVLPVAMQWFFILTVLAFASGQLPPTGKFIILSILLSLPLSNLER